MLVATVLLTTAIAVVSLWNPLAYRVAGLPHFSEAPPVWGAGALVVPIAVFGRTLYLAWWETEIDLAAWRQRRAVRRGQR